MLSGDDLGEAEDLTEIFHYQLKILAVHRSVLNRPGFDAASFLAKDADHGEEVSHRAAGARDPDGG